MYRLNGSSAPHETPSTLNPLWKRALNGQHKSFSVLTRTPDEKSYDFLPLHTKDVGRISWDNIDAYVNNAPIPTEVKEAYHISKKMMMSVDVLQTIPTTRPHKARLNERDFDTLARKVFISKCTERPRGFVQISTLPEKLDATLEPTRRRVLVVPWDHNNHITSTAYVPLCTIDDICSQLHTDGAVTADIAACFTHYPLTEESKHFYCFYYEHSDDSISGWYHINTIPTGGRHCPTIAQAVLLAIAATIKAENVVINAYIDNLRLCGRREEVTRGVARLKSAMHQLNFSWNIETEFSTSYTFLGVVCTHQTHPGDPKVQRATTQATTKSINKLSRIAHRIFEPDATHLDGLQLLGLLMWISRISECSLAKFYGPLKFFRRRAASNAPLDTQLKLWPCVVRSLHHWIRTAIDNNPAYIADPTTHAENDAVTVVGYSDASDEGYGALLFTKNRMYLLAGHWTVPQRTLHINQKEALALEMLVNKLTSLATTVDHLRDANIHIYVDNTTVCSIWDKERSRAYWANNWVMRTKQLIPECLRVTLQWIPSISNLADGPSRTTRNSEYPANCDWSATDIDTINVIEEAMYNPMYTESISSDPLCL